MKRILPILLVAACASEPGPKSEVTSIAIGQDVSLSRDRRGMAHIEARSMAAAMYGAGYAQAQDRAAQMHVVRMIMRGRSAELLGVAYDASCGGCAATQEGCTAYCNDENKKRNFTQKLISSDREMRTLGYFRRARQVWNRLPDDTPKLLQAFAAGVNQAMADSKTLDTGLAKLGLKKKDFFPWTPEDSLLAWARIGRFAGAPVSQARTEVGNLIGCLQGACPTGSLCDQPPPIDEDAAVVMPPKDGQWPPKYPGDQTASLLQIPGFPQLFPQGGDRHPPVTRTASHGWVAHGSKTDNGKPVLVGDPKLPLTAPNYWYQYHVKVQDEGVNAQLITIPGAGGAMVMGWNQYIAHTVTSGGGDVTDTFILTPGGRADSYVVDGRELDLRVFSEKILVRGGNAVDVTIRTSIFGPLMTRELAPSVGDFVEANMVAIRHAPLAKRNTDSVVSGYKMMRATNLWEYRDAIRHWMVPTVNALYAGVDKGASAGDPGHIAYHTLYAMPVRTPNVAYGKDFTGRLPLDGSLSSNDWDGYYDLNWHPHVIDPEQGYLFSGNHLPVGNWHHDLVYSGLGGTGDGYRSLRVRYLLAKLEQDNGGVLPAKELHLAHYDARSTGTELALIGLNFLADEGAIVRPTDFSQAPATREAKAGYALHVFDLWLADGGLLERSNKYTRLAGRMMKAMIDGFRYTSSNSPMVNQEMFCTWGNNLKFLKALEQDISVLQTWEREYLIIAAATAYDRAFAAEPTLPLDPLAWPERGLQSESAGYMTDLYCATYNHCSLDPAHDVGYELDRSWNNSLSDPKGDSWPFTVYFAEINKSRALLAPGVSGDPASKHFKDTIHLVEQASHGIDSIPPAPLNNNAFESVQKLIAP